MGKNIDTKKCLVFFLLFLASLALYAQDPQRALENLRQSMENFNREIEAISLEFKNFELRLNLAKDELRIASYVSNYRSNIIAGAKNMQIHYSADQQVMEANIEACTIMGNAVWALVKIKSAVLKTVVESINGVFDSLNEINECVDAIKSGNWKNLSDKAIEKIEEKYKEKIQEKGGEILEKMVDALESEGSPKAKALAGKYKEYKAKLDKAPVDEILEIMQCFYDAYNLKEKYTATMDEPGWEEKYLQDMLQKSQENQIGGVTYAMKKGVSALTNKLVAKVMNTKEYDPQVTFGIIERLIEKEKQYYDIITSKVNSLMARYDDFWKFADKSFQSLDQSFKQMVEEGKLFSAEQEKLREMMKKYPDLLPETYKQMQTIVKEMEKIQKEWDAELKRFEPVVKDLQSTLLKIMKQTEEKVLLNITMNFWDNYREGTKIREASEILQKYKEKQSRRLDLGAAMNTMLKSMDDFEEESVRENQVYPSFVMAAGSNSYNMILEDIASQHQAYYEKSYKNFQDIKILLPLRKIEIIFPQLPGIPTHQPPSAYELTVGESIHTVQVVYPYIGASNEAQDFSFRSSIKDFVNALPIHFSSRTHQDEKGQPITLCYSNLSLLGTTNKGRKIPLSGTIVPGSMPENRIDFSGIANIKIETQWQEMMLNAEGEIIATQKERTVVAKLRCWNIQKLIFQPETAFIMKENLLPIVDQQSRFRHSEAPVRFIGKENTPFAMGSKKLSVSLVLTCGESTKEIKLPKPFYELQFYSENDLLAEAEWIGQSEVMVSNKNAMESPRNGSCKIHAKFSKNNPRAYGSFTTEVYGIEFDIAKKEFNPINKDQFPITLPEDKFTITAKIGGNPAPEAKNIEIEWISQEVEGNKKLVLGDGVSVVWSVPKVVGVWTKIPVIVHLGAGSSIYYELFVYVDHQSAWPAKYFGTLASRYLPEYKVSPNPDYNIIYPQAKLQIRYQGPWSVVSGSKVEPKAKVFALYNVLSYQMDSPGLVKWKGYPLLNVPLTKEDGKFLENCHARWSGMIEEKDLDPASSPFEMDSEGQWFTKTTWNVPVEKKADTLEEIHVDIVEK